MKAGKQMIPARRWFYRRFDRVSVAPDLLLVVDLLNYRDDEVMQAAVCYGIEIKGENVVIYILYLFSCCCINNH